MEQKLKIATGDVLKETKKINWEKTEHFVKRITKMCFQT